MTEADDCRQKAVDLLAQANDALPVVVVHDSLVARAQVWATLAVSYELAGGGMMGPG